MLCAWPPPPHLQPSWTLGRAWGVAGGLGGVVQSQAGAPVNTRRKVSSLNKPPGLSSVLVLALGPLWFPIGLEELPLHAQRVLPSAILQ